jgi:hypothetical protein
MTITNSNKNPFDVLQSVTQQTFDKISATDTRVLNRRLRRVFDMSELSDLSNSIISNILVDLSEFKTQFEWVNDYYHDDPTSTEYFFPLVLSIQGLLKELGTMKMTLNDLQADYVKRIERIQEISSSSSLLHYHSHHQRPITIILPPRMNKEEQQQQQQQQPTKSFMQGLLSLFTLH